MSTLEKLGTLVIGVAMATTLVLPKRQTPAVLGGITSLIRGVLSTAMGTGKPV